MITMQYCYVRHLCYDRSRLPTTRRDGESYQVLFIDILSSEQVHISIPLGLNLSTPAGNAQPRLTLKRGNGGNGGFYSVIYIIEDGKKLEDYVQQGV